MSRRTRGRAAVVIGLVGLLLVAPATAALAHPLGNFTVNHYNGLTLRLDGLDLLTIIDTAEIPTQQALPSIDTDGDDAMSTAELAAQADAQCAAVAEAVAVQVNNQPVPLVLGPATLETLPGVAGLPTLRLTCPRSAKGDLTGPSVVTLLDDYRTDRVGWHEITAVGEGVRLLDSPVASASISDELRTYPVELLQSPLDQRSLTVRTEPGTGGSTDSFDPASGSPDPFSRLIAAGDRALQDLVGDRELTPLVGALAVLLAVLLGSGHALLPGHGKAVMAAYLAGKRGSRRDAFLVGATVTATHTASVLVLGLLISLSATVVGEGVLRVLGIVSGALIAIVGGFLLVGALRSRRAARAQRIDDEFQRLPVDAPVGALATTSGQSIPTAPHDHQHDHTHQHDRNDGHDHPHPHEDGHEHDGPHPHEHGHDHDHEHEHDGHTHSGGWWGGHSHHHGQRGHRHGEPATDRRAGRLGIAGMGIAGGLVPSPSALVVLLGAVNLGQTVFGVLMVFAYGLGMAGTLTAVGLLLVRFRDRIDRYGTTSRLGRRAAAFVRALPIITALLVLVVGLALVLRGLLLAA